MNLIQADYIFPATAAPIKNGMLRIDHQGTILELIDPGTALSLPEAGNVQTHKGFICPGFVNSHCHLELSYLKNQIAEKCGITGFISGLLAVRNKSSKEVIEESIEMAEREMIKNGIVAVGDISNTADTFKQKSLNKLHYHTFLELFDLDDENAETAFMKGQQLRVELERTMPPEHTSSCVPHAPYTVSKKLFELLNGYASENNSLMTIHNQESADENELFMKKTGALFDFFTQAGINMKYISKTGFNSLMSTLPLLPDCPKTMLVHNTYTKEADVLWAIQHSKKVYWCFCVNANLYIENRIPEIKNFLSQSSYITLGTDSLASNHGLSILEEMKTIVQYNPGLSLAEVISWATINGAAFFNIQDRYGSFEIGKMPGINLIERVDSTSLKITPSSTIMKLF